MYPSRGDFSCSEEKSLKKLSLKELNLYFNIMNVKLFLLNQEMLDLGVKSHSERSRRSVRFVGPSSEHLIHRRRCVRC